MSMIRAQEYFAPLRSRHISLQQWERGLLFESWGSHGGRGDRRKSGDLTEYLATPSESGEVQHEYRRPVKVIARSVSFSATVGSEPVRTKNFARGLSFPRSLASRGDIIPEESDFCTGLSRRPNAADLSPMFAAKASTAYGLFPMSVESCPAGHIESEVSDHSSSQDSEDSSESFSSDLNCPADHVLESRPLPRRFFSGGISLSRDRKFLSGVLSFSKDKKIFSGSLSLPKPCLAPPCGRTLERSQSLGVNDGIYGLSSSGDPDHTRNGTATRSSTEARLKNRFLAKVLSFSRSLDPRGEIPSDESVSKSNRRTEVRRGLSFSRSLDVNGELQLSSDDCDDCGSPNSSSLHKPERYSWSKRFISRSGLFFSRTLSPKVPREPSPPAQSVDITSSDENIPCSEEQSEPAEVRSKKLFGRFSLSFSRFLNPKCEACPNPGAGAVGSGAGKADKYDSNLKRFLTRAFQFSNAKSVDPADHSSSIRAACGSACDGNGAPPPGSSGPSTTKTYSKRFFSKEWSWSRSSKSRSTSPAKNSSRPMAAYSRNLSAADETDEFYHLSNRKDSDFAVPSARHSQSLRNWWSKRTNGSSRSALASDQHSRLVLLEKMPASGDQDSENLTVYVGERGGSLTKYVLEKHILRHHLFQVLLKCSQDELGTDHDYNSGVPIICDPALFLQVARVVGGHCSAEHTLCR